MHLTGTLRLGWLFCGCRTLPLHARIETRRYGWFFPRCESLAIISCDACGRSEEIPLSIFKFNVELVNPAATVVPSLSHDGQRAIAVGAKKPQPAAAPAPVAEKPFSNPNNNKLTPGDKKFLKDIGVRYDDPE